MHGSLQAGRVGAQGIVRVKNMRCKDEGDEKGDAVPRDALVEEMRARIQALGTDDSLLTRPPAALSPNQG